MKDWVKKREYKRKLRAYVSDHMYLMQIRDGINWNELPEEEFNRQVLKLIDEFHRTQK